MREATIILFERLRGDPQPHAPPKLHRREVQSGRGRYSSSGSAACLLLARREGGRPVDALRRRQVRGGDRDRSGERREEEPDAHLAQV